MFTRVASNGFDRAHLDVLDESEMPPTLARIRQTAAAASVGDHRDHRLVLIAAKHPVAIRIDLDNPESGGC